MRNFIEDVSMLCRDLIEGKGLTPLVEITPFFPETLNIDPERITQVIMNLISNSIKFTQTGSIKLSFEWIPDEKNVNELDYQEESSLYLTACNDKFSKKFGEGNDHYNSKWFLKSKSKYPGTLKFAVTDTGIGISKADLERIFEKFAQAESNTELKSLGLGLGLWISKAIVNRHKGQIFVDSKEGSGSSFTVTIPTTTDIASTVAACSSNASSLRLERSTLDQLDLLQANTNSNTSSIIRHTKALVIEDCAINQAINKTMLSKFGIEEVMVASNGLEGLKIFKEKGPQYFDLITVDLEMPVMKGKEAIMEIRKWEYEHKLSATKIVIISGNAVEREMQECLNPQGKIRADEFLTKPCDYNQLLQKLNGLGIGKTRKCSSTMTSKKVLVADDDFFNLDIVKSFSAQLGIDYLTAKNGKEAVQIYEAHADDIALILLDNEMPILNGIEACKEIRKLINKREKSARPLIVSLSGHDSDASLKNVFDRCIQKPVTFETYRDNIILALR